ncbi:MULTISPECIES: hypothetical protein [Alteromonadaceae]|uniref:hypothetical protein n=1 Tax=Alteromonadaceae TaxID=72275 RepID=UPI001C08761D|nr:MULTISPECIES: hypothetical protein [Aliiglaciecola]MBU2878112.1 hypothetical protein [Aliiglaciecola lipolytica]MDO6711560.1 hypothetical protein [Aliiglaciecola sp. 2_MG-2023]MDO6752631.1 hypothetical protein [Aliiglaciecola sp. 1_MG-2023]
MSTSSLKFLKNRRFWLSGPATLVVSLLFMLAMAVWFPPGAGHVNNIMMPMFMFPLIWAILFFYTYLTTNLQKAQWLLATLFVANSAILAFQFLG